MRSSPGIQPRYARSQPSIVACGLANSEQAESVESTRYNRSPVSLPAFPSCQDAFSERRAAVKGALTKRGKANP